MALVQFVCQCVVFIFFLDKSFAVPAPVIKNSPQILSAKLDRDGPSSSDWQHQRRFLSPLIDTGDLDHPLPSASPTSLSTGSYSEKTRTNSDKTRDSLKIPVHQPKRRDETSSPRVFSPELFQFFKQYGRLTRVGEQPRSSEAQLRIYFPARRGKQFEKVDVVQKITDSSDEEDEGNVQKIDRKKEEPGEEMILEEIVEEDDGDEEVIEEIQDLRGNRTETETDENDATTRQKTDYFAIIYLGGFVILVTFFFVLACSEIFCQNCLYRSTSNPFLPQAHCTHSYYQTPKPVTPPPPYHLFAPPQYIDIVKDLERGRTVQCACPPGTPCPPYSRERTQDRTDLVSIMHIDERRPRFQATPATPLKEMKNASENIATSFENKTAADSSEEMYVHRIPSEPILCPCSKQERMSNTPLHASPVLSDNLLRQSISFVEYNSGQENLSAFKNSISFNDSYLDGQSLFSNDEKNPLESTNQSQDQCQFETHSTSVEKVNETEKTALSAFSKDNKQFRNQLKTRIRNSVSFSSSQNSTCSDQLEKQFKHSISYTEQIDKAMDDHMSRSHMKQHQHSSCFTIGALHHSIPELIKLNDDKMSNCFVKNYQQSQRTERDGQNIEIIAENLLNSLNTSYTRLTNPIEADCKTSSSYKTDLEVNNTVITCDQATNTCSTWTNTNHTESADQTQENLKTKIFFIDDMDDEDNIQTS